MKLHRPQTHMVSSDANGNFRSFRSNKFLKFHFLAYRILDYSGQKKKLSVPKQGQNFPEMIKSRKFLVQNRFVTGKKYFVCFRVESFFFRPLYEGKFEFDILKGSLHCLLLFAESMNMKAA